MQRISEVRKKIDEIDEEMLRALKKRLSLCESIGAIKRGQGVPIRDIQRESKKCEHITKRSLTLGLDPHEVMSIYKKIIAMSIHVQEPGNLHGTKNSKNSLNGIAKEEMMLHEIAEKVVKLENEGKKIIKFNVGDPDQQTPAEIVDAMVKALKQGKTKYSSSGGEKELREELAEAHGISPENVVITTGSKWAIFSIMYLLLKKGENIIIISPHWADYEAIAKTLGVRTRFLNTKLDSGWKIEIAELENLIDDDTRLLILNNPNNPTSKVIESVTLEKLVQVANEKQLKILSDEVYSDLSFVRIRSVLDFAGGHMLVKSFSKTFAMTGWRIGYAIVGDELAEKMIKLNQTTLTNVPAFIQDAALKALELKDRICKKMQSIYKRRADLACKILSGTKLKFTKPDAPFYIFPRKEKLNSEKLASGLIRQGIAITPGSSFGNYRDHFRIALTVSEEEIELGLKKLCEGLK